MRVNRPRCLFVLAALALTPVAAATTTPTQTKSRITLDYVDNGVTTPMADIINTWNNTAEGDASIAAFSGSPADMIDGHVYNTSVATGATSVSADAYTFAHWDLGMDGQFTSHNRYMITFDASGGDSISLNGKIRGVGDTRYEDPSNDTTVTQVTMVYVKNMGTGETLYSVDLTAAAADGLRDLQTVNFSSGSLSLGSGSYRIVFDTLQTITVGSADNIYPVPYVEAGTDKFIYSNWKTWEVAIDGLTPGGAGLLSIPEPATAALWIAGALTGLARRRRAAPQRTIV